MRRARLPLALTGLSLALAGCSGSAPPHELAGLWSSGPASCAAGVGVRFGDDAIAAVYPQQRETLFEKPRYDVESTDDNHFVVRIHYALPTEAGGASSVGAEGVLVLERTAEGGLVVASHNLLDSRTGSARVAIKDDPAMNVLRLKPCGAHPWVNSLRGRRDS